MSQFPFQRLQTELAVIISHTPPGERLPSEPVLSRQLGVSRATLREAMRAFETQGLIRRRQGAGTFVVGQVPILESGLEVLESLETLAKRQNKSIAVRYLHIDEILADRETAEALNVPLGTPLTRVQRVILTDNRPAAYLIDILPQDVLRPGDLPERFGGSVLDYLLQRGDALTISRADISATNATTEVARAMEIQRDDVLLKFTSRLYSASGRIVDYSHSYFLPGYFHFHIVRKVGGA
jgi:GntR family transcriptional regulator